MLYDAGEGLVAPAADRLRALGYTDVRRLDGGLQAWQAAGYELFPGRQFLRQGVRRTGGAAAAHAVIARGRSRGADCKQRQYRGARCPAVRRICDHEHSRSVQRARRRTGAAGRPRRAGPGDHDRRQLRRPHPLDHRHPVAHQRRRRQQGAGAAERHHRLDAGKPASRAWRRPARRHRPVRGRRGQCPRGGLSRRRSALERGEARALEAQTNRTLYRFDVRDAEEYTAGHFPGFRHYPAASSCRRSTWRPRCAARASC